MGTETDPDSETFCLLASRIPDAGQSPSVIHHCQNRLESTGTTSTIRARTAFEIRVTQLFYTAETGYSDFGTEG
jgi:hypothetical protein